MMTGDNGDHSRTSSTAGPTLTHLQRHGSTASDCTTSSATRSYASSQYSSGYISSASGGSVAVNHSQGTQAVCTTSSMPAAVASQSSAGAESNKPLAGFEERDLREGSGTASTRVSAHSSKQQVITNAFSNGHGGERAETGEGGGQRAMAGGSGTGYGRHNGKAWQQDEESDAGSDIKPAASSSERRQATGVAVHKASIERGSSSSPQSSESSDTSAAAAASTSQQALPSTGEQRVKRIGRYTLSMQTLGKGNFARVELAHHTQIQAKVAIKIIQTDRIKEDYVKRNLLRESAIMRQLQHPNIIRLYETMKTSSLYCIVTECAEGGELLNFVKNECPNRCMPEPLARHFIRQLVSALFHMHQHGIVHRDLKMENILLDKSKRNIKIIDFGLSNCHEPGELLATHCGSPEYAAPELFIPGQVYGQEVDVWSLGVNMFAMLAGKLPFRVPKQGVSRRKRLLDQISSGIGPQQEEESKHFSPSAMDLVRCLLQPDPAQRCTLPQAMMHPWLTCDASQPLLPYQLVDENAAARDRIVDLMCARLDTQRSSVLGSIKEKKCDWMAAIYHLLHDQPHTQAILRDLHRSEISNPAPRPSVPEPTTAATTATTATAAATTAATDATSENDRPPLTSITAVMRKLEAAAGKPLTQTKGVQRHQSLGAADGHKGRSAAAKDKSDKDVERSMDSRQAQSSAQPSTRSAFRSRFSLARRSNRQKTASAPATPLQSAPVPDVPAAIPSQLAKNSTSKTAADCSQESSKSKIVGSPIRQALDSRSVSTRATRSLSSGAIATSIPRRLSNASTGSGDGTAVFSWQQQQSESEPASTVHSRQGSADSSGSQPSTPRKKRPASAGAGGRLRHDWTEGKERDDSKLAAVQSGEQSSTRTGAVASQPVSVPSSTTKKKKRNSLFGSLRGKEKSPSTGDIAQLKELDSKSKFQQQQHQHGGAASSLPAPGTTSLSRSFDLKPHALSTDGAGTPVMPHRPHTLQPRSSDYNGFFGQAVPQYELTMPWAGPVFSGYMAHSMDDSSLLPRQSSGRRSSSRNRANSSLMGDALTGYTSAYLQSSPFSGGQSQDHMPTASQERRSSYEGAAGRSSAHPFLMSSQVPRPSQRRASSGSIPLAPSSTNSGKTFGLLRRSLRRKQT